MCLIGDKVNCQKRLGRRNSENRSIGFTLVELLVVISIIALLLAVLMPALQKARKQGQTVKCAISLKQIGLACQSYAYEYKDFAPPAHKWQDLDAGKYLANMFPLSTIKYPWQYHLWPYHKNFVFMPRKSEIIRNSGEN